VSSGLLVVDNLAILALAGLRFTCLRRVAASEEGHALILPKVEQLYPPRCLSQHLSGLASHINRWQRNPAGKEAPEVLSHHLQRQHDHADASYQEPQHPSDPTGRRSVLKI
jgi:hypothetical protein